MPNVKSNNNYIKSKLVLSDYYKNFNNLIFQLKKGGGGQLIPHRAPPPPPATPMVRLWQQSVAPYEKGWLPRLQR